MPKTVEIINTSYSLYYVSLEMRASFLEDDYKTIKEGIDNFAEGYILKVDIKDKIYRSSFRAFCKYWEEEKETVLVAYYATKQGRWGAKTRDVCILITRDKGNGGQYYLHIYY